LRPAPGPGRGELLRLAQTAPGNPDHLAGSLRPVRGRGDTRGTTVAAGRRPLPSAGESLGDNGTRLGRAQPATDFAVSRTAAGGATSGKRSRGQPRAAATGASLGNTIPTPPPTTVRTLPAGYGSVPFRPEPGGDQPDPWYRPENHSALVAARRVSRAQAAAPPAAESERVCRLPRTTLERGLPQCVAPLSRDSPARLCGQARHGEAVCFQLEKNGEAHLAGGSPEDLTQACRYPGDSPSRQDQR